MTMSRQSHSQWAAVRHRSGVGAVEERDEGRPSHWTGTSWPEQFGEGREHVDGLGERADHPCRRSRPARGSRTMQGMA